MKIAILGAGALGCYYGARLAEAGHDVRFIGRSVCEPLKAEGLHVEGDEIAALQLWIDGVPTACTSRVEGERLIVESDGLQPDADAELRYAWENYCTVNCYNAAQLPVFPFLIKNK